VVALVTASALSGALFNLGPLDFLGLGSASKSGWSKSGDAHNVMITLKELMQGSQYGSGVTIGKAMKLNIKANAPMAVGTVVGVTIANTLARKVGIYRTLNRMVRQVGLGKVVKF
jgi:hypothetical protein